MHDLVWRCPEPRNVGDESPLPLPYPGALTDPELPVDKGGESNIPGDPRIRYGRSELLRDPGTIPSDAPIEPADERGASLNQSQVGVERIVRRRSLVAEPEVDGWCTKLHVALGQEGCHRSF